MLQVVDLPPMPGVTRPGSAPTAATQGQHGRDPLRQADFFDKSIP